MKSANRKKQGKIIAISGGPRSGKSFLARLLTRHYKAKLLIEGEEEDFPARIKKDISKNIRPLERIMWFNNKLMEKYLDALEYKNQGKTVILDTFWLDDEPYIDILPKGFERKILKEMARINHRIFEWPDVVIFLDISPAGMKQFIKIGLRKFDKSQAFLDGQALPVNNLYRKFFAQKKFRGKIIKINRDNLDFMKQEDLLKIIRLIDSKINRSGALPK